MLISILRFPHRLVFSDFHTISILRFPHSTPFVLKLFIRYIGW